MTIIKRLGEGMSKLKKETIKYNKNLPSPSANIIYKYNNS